MPDKYAILQLKETDETAWERFMSLAYLREHGREPKPSHYDLIYTGDLNPEWKQPLEALFFRFNANAPADFTGRSMSVSDIVAIQTGGTATKYYYCDSYGFKRLTGFRHPAVEQMRETTDRGHQRLPGGN